MKTETKDKMKMQTYKMAEEMRNIEEMVYREDYNYKELDKKCRLLRQMAITLGDMAFNSKEEN